MRKKLCLWCNFVIVAVLFLSSCRNEDFSSSLAESKREEEFFRNNTEGADFKNVNTSLVSSTISKLKNLNDKTDFISKLSDKDGLPAWNYIAKSKIKTANKGGDGGQILIVPLKVEDGFLSSLMYVKNADSSDPTVYTVTNEQLKDFAENKSIDKDTRESILRTFISFDNAMFGSRLYSSIPSDLFENVPLKENHDHKSFTIGQYEPTQNMDIEQCFMTFHCKNQLEESRCDMCWKCVSITCPLGGGNTDYEPDFPNSPGGNDDGGNDGGGQTNPNIPWYLQNPEIDIFSKSPAVQSVFQSLTDYGFVMHVSQVNYLQENNTIAQRFKTYLASNNSLEKSKFAIWGINFFMDNPDTTWEQFYNWFLTPSEGKDWNYDANFWDDPNLTFPAQSLPSWSAFSSAYPNQTSAQMYGVVGGAVAQAQIDYPVETQNGCALKVSRALNYSGVIIPNIPGKTLKGADNKNYFLNAKSLNARMRKTFGVSPSNPRHINITKLQGGINGKNFPNLIKNKKGIFSMVSPPNSTWASGHADILYSNGTCKAGCHFFDGDILYIDFWELN